MAVRLAYEVNNSKTKKLKNLKTKQLKNLKLKNLKTKMIPLPNNPSHRLTIFQAPKET